MLENSELLLDIAGLPSPNENNSVDQVEGGDTAVYMVPDERMSETSINDLPSPD